MSELPESGDNRQHSALQLRPGVILGAGVLALLTAVLFWHAVRDMIAIWSFPDSYYSHGYLIAPISLFLVWRKRRELQETPVAPAFSGYGLLCLAALMLLGSDFLGFAVFGQMALVVMIAGLALIFLGYAQFKILFFPIVFLFFMVPIPPSMTQAIALDLKLLATNLAVMLARLMTVPVVQDGSYVRFENDFLLIGDVCGGLRSLISMLALGALMAYLSQSKPWAKGVILLLAGPVAIASNVFRICLLCIVGYFWGSEVASGTVHDVSGFLMFGVAFALFFAFEAFLRRIAPAASQKGESA